MVKIKKFFKNLCMDESGQGTAEYVLLIVIVIGLLMMFKGRIKTVFSNKLDEVADGMGGITTKE